MNSIFSSISYYPILHFLTVSYQCFLDEEHVHVMLYRYGSFCEVFGQIYYHY